MSNVIDIDTYFPIRKEFLQLINRHLPKHRVWIRRNTMDALAADILTDTVRHVFRHYKLNSLLLNDPHLLAYITGVPVRVSIAGNDYDYLVLLNRCIAKALYNRTLRYQVLSCYTAKHYWFNVAFQLVITSKYPPVTRIRLACDRSYKPKWVDKWIKSLKL